jgi:NAD(P)H-dependent FMN reductase
MWKNDCYSITDNEASQREGKWKTPKSVLGIQASPRKKKGTTEIIYSYFVEGVKSAGVDVETFYLADMDIKPCLGCFKCWTRKEENCVIEDEMTDFVSKIPDYDLMIFATPLYIDGMSGLLKNFIDRMIPLNHPSIVLINDRCVHPCRFQKMPNLILLSVCGFHELTNFDPLLEHISAISRNMHMPLLSAVLRPETLSLMSPLSKGPMHEIKDALKKAGQQTIKEGKSSKESLQIIRQPFMSKRDYIETAKSWWK